MMSYIKLLRIPNLIFIAGIQLLMHFCVVAPIMYQYGMAPSISLFQLGLLMVATTFIAAGGYIINDYFDIRIDEINRPDSVIIGKSVSRKQAMTFYMVITGIGLVAGLLLSYQAKSINYGFIFLMIVGLLWFYSSSYKRQFIVGNLIVSALAAMVPLIVALFENQFILLQYGLSPEWMMLSRTILHWIGGFAAFAFIWTFIREIIKDMEDEQGDREMECHTFPVVLGIAKTKIILYLLIALMLGVGGYVTFALIPAAGSLSWRYLVTGVGVPSLLLVYFLYKAKTKAEYRLSARLAKIIMVIGTLYSVLIWYLMKGSVN